MNIGNKALFERELFLLHDILPKDADVHDGLQLIDGADPSRHVIDASPTVPAPPPPVAPAPAPAAPLPAIVGSAPVGVVLPLPSQPMRLEELPSHLSGRTALPTRASNGHVSGGARQDERVDDWDVEEDDEIRPVNDERSAQLRAYRAAGF